MQGQLQLYRVKFEFESMTAQKRQATELIKIVANNIKQYRLKKNLSQERLEDETGLTIARYESGNHDMTLTTICILSQHLDLEPYELLK